MPQLLRMPRTRPTQEELERAGEQLIREYKRSELIRNIVLYGSAAALFALGMLTEYLLTR